MEREWTSDLTGKLRRGVTDIGTTLVEKGKKLYETGKDDKEIYERIKHARADAKERMEHSAAAYEDTCLILTHELQHLEKVADELRGDFHSIGIALSARARGDLNMQHIEVKDAVMAESIMSGVAVGSLAAGSAVLLTASFGTAGTGAAISGLTGTYAVNATLAALGGGTLASGGFGIAGGLVVASALFTVPAIAVAGILAHNKIREMARETEELLAETDAAIALNAQVGERNLAAAEKIRNLCTLGTNIRFLLGAVRNGYRFDYKVMAALQDKLGKAFFAIEIFQGREIHPELDAIIQEIESDVLFLSEAVFEQMDNTKERYTEQEINAVFKQIYKDAQEFIYLLYPWFNMKCAQEDKEDLEKASKRGVEIYICYGMGEDKRENERFQSTKEAVNWLKDEIDSIKVYQVDSHMKIAVCDKYVLHGSQNMMTYRYGTDAVKRNDVRSEITTKDTNEREIQEFKRIFEREIFKDV